MTIEVFADNSLDDFLSEAGPLLFQHEAANALMLGLTLSWTPSPHSQEIRLFRVVKHGRTRTAAVQTPPFNFIVTFADDDELDHLVMELASRGLDFPGVLGPSREARYFAGKWSEISGKSQVLGMSQKIYKADMAILPSVRGTLKKAVSEDVELVADWLYQFSEESLPEREKFSRSFAEEGARKAIETGTAYLFLADGIPVSAAHTGRPTKNGISIRAVYTPREKRKNGFASAVTGHLTKKMLESGYQFCCLYTDASNPTSNKIYQDVGYVEVVTSELLIFGEATDKKPGT